jgi:hypothetical protein
MSVITRSGCGTVPVIVGVGVCVGEGVKVYVAVLPVPVTVGVNVGVVTTVPVVPVLVGVGEKVDQVLVTVAVVVAAVPVASGVQVSMGPTSIWLFLQDKNEVKTRHKTAADRMIFFMFPSVLPPKKALLPSL